MTPKEGQKGAEKAIVASREKDTEIEKAMHMQPTTERDEQLERLRRRYGGRGKEGKSRLLDEFCGQHGYESAYDFSLTDRTSYSEFVSVNSQLPARSRAILAASAAVTSEISKVLLP